MVQVIWSKDYTDPSVSIIHLKIISVSATFIYHYCINVLHMSESESELFTGDTSKDNHSPGPVFREVSP